VGNKKPVCMGENFYATFGRKKKTDHTDSGPGYSIMKKSINKKVERKKGVAANRRVPGLSGEKGKI